MEWRWPARSCLRGHGGGPDRRADRDHELGPAHDDRRADARRRADRARRHARRTGLGPRRARRRVHHAGSGARRRAHRAHRGPRRLQPGPPLHRRHAVRLGARQAQGQHPQARRVPERRRPVHVDDGHVPEPADRLLLRDEPVRADGRRAEGRRAAPTPASGTASGTRGRGRARSAGCSRSTCPFRSLAFDPNAPAWGINFQRTVRRKQEELLWTGHQRNQGLQRMANAGLLVGLNDVSPGPRLRAAAVRVRLRGRRARPHAAGVARHRRATSASTWPTTSRRACAAWPRSTPTSPRPKSTSAWSTSPASRCSCPSGARFFLDGATFFDLPFNSLLLTPHRPRRRPAAARSSAAAS